MLFLKDCGWITASLAVKQCTMYSTQYCLMYQSSNNQCYSGHNTDWRFCKFSDDGAVEVRESCYSNCISLQVNTFNIIG